VIALSMQVALVPTVSILTHSTFKGFPYNFFYRQPSST
jgi:hypothetical protein